MGVDQLVTGGDFDDPVVDSLTSDSVNTGQLGIANTDPLLESSSTTIQSTGMAIESGSTTSNSYENVASGVGAWDFSNKPDGVTVYGNFLARFETDGDTGFIRPELGSEDNDFVALSELEVSHASSTFTTVTSGWVEITSISLDKLWFFSIIQLKVDSGEINLSGNRAVLAIDWRID